MKAKEKIAIIVSGQIILIISSFLFLSYLQNENAKIENAITLSRDTRALSDALMFETERYLAGVPYANPHIIIDELHFNMRILLTGGIYNNDVIDPIPGQLLNTRQFAMEKADIYVNHLEEIFQERNLQIDFKNNEFVILDTQRFDFNGALDVLTQQLDDNAEKQMESLIMLEIGLGVLNVGVHIFLILVILDILSKESQKIMSMQKLANIGQLASRFAHDVRNPLFVIKASLDLLKQKPELYEKEKERFDMMDDSVQRITHQVENVLDFVKKKPLEFEEHSLSKVIEPVFDKIQIPTTVKIKKQLEDVNLTCDQAAMQVVLINLLMNAIQSMNENGELKIRSKQNENHIIIEIEDSGPGIPKDKMQEIFEPLFTTKQKGTGLGLTSCKTLIEQHGGMISVKNNPTTFTIILPKITIKN